MERRGDTVIQKQSCDVPGGSLQELPNARPVVGGPCGQCPKALLPEQGVEASWCLFGTMVECCELLSHGGALSNVTEP